jgi:hypothetical protein
MFRAGVGFSKNVARQLIVQRVLLFLAYQQGTPSGCVNQMTSVTKHLVLWKLSFLIPGIIGVDLPVMPVQLAPGRFD